MWIKRKTRNPLAVLLCLAMAACGPAALGGQETSSAPRGGGAEAAYIAAAGDDWESIAVRTLEDAAAAPEIRAYNNLPAEASVQAGMKLRIPSLSDRKFALSAIENIQNAVLHLRNAGVPKNLEARAREIDDLLEKARELLELARYQDVIGVGDTAMTTANEILEKIDKRTVFDVEIRPGGTPAEDTSVFSIFKGKVKVDTPDGSTVLKEGQAGKVNAGTGKMTVEKMLDPPQPESPANGRVIYTHEIRFAWKPVPKVAEFKIEIAGDVRFSAIEVEEIVKGSNAAIGEPLPDGTYYWRVSCLNGEGIPGKWSDHRSFVKRYDAEPPELELGQPIWK